MKLGQKTAYPSSYNPSLLEPILRSPSRDQIGYNQSMFKGLDLWTIYEFSHLDPSGKPINAILSLEIPQASKFIIESKSLKLYFNSFNLLRKSFKEAVSSVETDISSAISCKFDMRLPEKRKNLYFDYIENDFINLDGLLLDDIKSSEWTKTKSSNDDLEIQRFYTSLFRSHCPVTNQPDWASIFISIKSDYKIYEPELLNYLVSFREHQAFHENCVEEIIVTLKEEFKCTSIAVYARFTRRGGIDINPYRYYGDEDPIMADIIEKSKRLEFWDPRQ